VVIPVLQGMYYAFTDWSGIGAAEFIGLENFYNLFFKDANFRNAFSNNLVWMVIFLTIPFVLALAVASILAPIKRGGLFFRTALFVPYLLPAVAGAFIWRTLYSSRYGLGAELAKWGIAGLDIAYLGRTDTALPAIALANIWSWWGFLMVLFLTAIQAVPVDLYDAAKMDGANRWQEFLHVTLPGIRPTVLYMLMVTAATLFASFQYVHILTGGGPAGSSELVATYLYKQAFSRFEMGYASAIGLTVAALAAIIIGLFSLLRKRGWDI
jgi:raffinose/stachyose/melibiose transport system permease protein